MPCPAPLDLTTSANDDHNISETPNAALWARPTLDAISYLSSPYIALFDVQLSRPTLLDLITSGNNDHNSLEMPNVALQARPNLGQIRSMSMVSSTTSPPPTHPIDC